MKQNSSILFHSMGASSFLSKISFVAVGGVVFFFAGAVTAAETTQPTPYEQYFDPAKGFKPAQPNLTKIFLQMAGSLEYYGSPEPYLRHVMAEHARIDAIYQKATGKKGSSRPAYFTDEYLENLLAGWNKLTPILKLDNLSRLAGRDMRYAIMGSWNKAISEFVEQETNLSSEEKSAYRALLQKPYFSKVDFSALDGFYKTVFDKLSDDGKSQISTRTWRGQKSPENRAADLEKSQGGTVIIGIFNEHQMKLDAYLNTDVAKNVNSDDLKNALITRLKLGQDVGDTSKLPAFSGDALRYSHDIETGLEKRFDHVQKTAKSPQQAKEIHKAIISMVENLLVVAHSELMAALREQIAKQY